MRPNLPHAAPMHWIDDAELSPDGLTATATRFVSADHPFVENGCLLPTALIELLAQCAAAGAGMKTPIPKRGMLVAISRLQIFAPVPIGSTLNLRATHLKTFGPLSMTEISASIGDTLIASAQMTFHLSFE